MSQLPSTHARTHATWEGVMHNFRGDTRYPEAGGVGAWQDPDMLVVGMPLDGREIDAQTHQQWQTHFSLWAMVAAPLWAGVDLTKLPSGAMEIFLNEDIIAIDQDALGLMAKCRSGSGCGGNDPLHPPASVEPCVQHATQWERLNETANSSLLHAVGTDWVLTGQECTGQPGDNIILWEPVPGSCEGAAISNQVRAQNKMCCRNCTVLLSHRIWLKSLL